MLRKKIERILQGADIDYTFGSGVMEFHIEGFYHLIEFADAKEAVLTAGSDVWDLNDDTYEDILNAIL